MISGRSSTVRGDADASGASARLARVSSYATAYLDDGREFCGFRNVVDEFFLMLFTPDDWIDLDGTDAARFQPHIEATEARAVGYRASVAALRSRLDLMGMPAAVAAAQLVRTAEERAREITNFVPVSGLSAEDERELAYLTNLNWEDWCAQLRVAIERGDRLEEWWGPQEPRGTASRLLDIWDYELEEGDSRYRLRSILEVLPDDAQITLNLADLIDGGWLENAAELHEADDGRSDSRQRVEPIDPQAVGLRQVVENTTGLLPPVVLVEGKFDVEVLTAALRIRRPHLIPYFRFPDFSHKNEGGTGALRQTIRAFAASGIPNRVLALFDNDTAARDMLRTIDMSLLPSNIQITCLPDLDLARRYPTIGPQGEHVMDVNGLAASIEMFLGTDVLTVDGALVPVQWSGYSKGVGAYQGELADKSVVQERFRQKVARASGSPRAQDAQDWSALDLVLDHIAQLLAQSPLPEGQA